MIAGFTVLLLCQLAGEVVARGLGLPFPGPVLGMVFLAVGLAVTHRRRGPTLEVEALPVTRVADGLLANLSLLYVPASVGIIEQVATLRSQALALGVALVVSTALTLLVTVLVFLAVKRWTRCAEVR